MLTDSLAVQNPSLARPANRSGLLEHALDRA
jgi:hypothetical protein